MALGVIYIAEARKSKQEQWLQRNVITHPLKVLHLDLWKSYHPAFLALQLSTIQRLSLLLCLVAKNLHSKLTVSEPRRLEVLQQELEIDNGYIRCDRNVLDRTAIRRLCKLF